MRTKASPATGTTTSEKTRPITISVQGDLARKIRDHAKEIGFQAKTSARQFLEWGHLCVADNKEGQDFRDRLGNTRGNTPSVNISREVVELLKVILDASGTNMTVGEYIEKSIIGEVAESLLPKRYGNGVQDFIANEYVLESQDMPNMNRAAGRWASRNPESAARIQSLNANR